MAQRVTVIGGGVIGLATAYALVREGMAVDLIEARESLAVGTSYANGGQLSYRYVSPLADAGVPLQALGWLLRSDSPLKLRPRLDLAQWRWMGAFMAACRTSVNRSNAAHLLRLALHSQATLAHWREDDRLEGFAWRRNGKLVTFRNPASFAHARRHLLDPQGQQVLDAAGIAALEPALADAPFIGGVYTADEEVADCHRFCLALAERLQASGQCRLLLGQGVTRIRHAGGVVQALELADQVIPVERLVLCAGHRSASLGIPGLQLPIYPLKGYSLTAPIGVGQRAPDVSITDYDRKIVYARLEDQLRVAAMVDIVGFDDSLDPARLASMRQLAVTTLPHAADYAHAREWAGMRPATPSGVPLLGATRYRNLWLNLGHGALGFTLACASGALLAELIGGRAPSIDLHGLSPRAA
ncbi:D-amino acid dehydrogenase [Pseudomonas sp. GD03860]|uniref:D-amino acid dehydrogenase n=1 Tax=Pseudomonas TaxID=286 RepID=UPI00236423B9|nr:MULTISPECIES: D-amino acid dehydrogenase [Pseudomonas]MDD2061386.1 D-amino acid dehydrogenase [Pseudomonas putida]MDH0640377.1 D-amino acid dehydrogenase [Pseudomonas sp. GD03860]